MLYDRIVDNKEIGRTIWKICTAFNNDLYSVERFALRWMICNTLNDSYYVEWFVLRWMICITLNDLNYVAWFAQRWIICSTALNYLYYVDWFVLRWMICTTLNDFLLHCKICATSNDLYSVERFVLRWMIRSTMDDLYNVESFGLWLLLIIGFLMCARCAYSRKYCKIFCINLWVVFSLIWRYQDYSALPHKLVI